MTLLSDSRAQAGTARAAVLLVVTLMVTAVIASVLAPVAINSIEGDNTDQLTQEVDTTYEINGELTANVTSVDTTNSQATVVLNDTRTGTTTSKTIGVGTTSTYNLGHGDVNVTVDSIDDTTTPNQATVTYEYAKDYAYSSGASSLWGILGLAIVLGLFLLLIARALRYT